MRGIRRLAKDLNISIGTVSRALNGRPDVSEETRRRVLAAAASANYLPNQAGRSLRQGSTNVVGFMIESGPDIGLNGDNFFLGVFDGVQAVLSRHGLDLVVLPCPAAEDPADYLRRMVGRGHVDAVILSAVMRADPRVPILEAAGLPFITLGRTGTDTHAWLDLDFEGVASRSVARLLERGHRRIALGLPGDGINLGYVFREAYRAALERAGIAYDPSLVVRGRSSEEGGYAIADEILGLDAPPTAIVLVYELMALGVYRRLMEHGLEPGRDLAVIGFRDSPQSRMMRPRLTSYAMSLHDLGEALAEALLGTMPGYAGQYPAEPSNRLWPLDLVPGESD